MTQGARICPHCKRRVDERRAKGLAYCLSCGQPLAGFAATSAPPSLRGGTPPPSQYGVPPSQYGAPPSQYGGAPSQQYGSTPAPNYGATNPYASQPQIQQQHPQQRQGSGSIGLIIGIVIGLGGLLALGVAVVVVLFGRSSSSSSSSGTDTTDPTSAVAIETPTASADDTKPAPSGGVAHHPKPVGTSSGKIGEVATPNGTQPFPTTLAFERLDQAAATAERICPRTEGPFGTTIVDVTFETDGRVGTLSRKPIGGTPVGNCITAQFLEIRVGAFEGSSRTFSKSVTIRAPNGSTAPTATTSASPHNRVDGGH